MSVALEQLFKGECVVRFKGLKSRVSIVSSSPYFEAKRLCAGRSQMVSGRHRRDRVLLADIYLLK